MSLRDDLKVLERFLLANHAHAEEWTSYTALSAALSPAGLKWLEALPELLELQANLKNAVYTEYLEEFNLQVALRKAIYEAAALHTAALAVNAGTDNKEKK